nr:hypothetical protein [Tanacetum cinerariifolium]
RTNGACLLLGKVEEGRGNVIEVVEWPGMEERWGKNDSGWIFLLGKVEEGRGESWVDGVGGWKVGSWWENGRRENRF